MVYVDGGKYDRMRSRMKERERGAKIPKKRTHATPLPARMSHVSESETRVADFA